MNRLVLAATALVCGALLLLAGLRPAGRSLAGDEGTYTAMVESLALDGDLSFDQRDRERIAAPGPPGRDTVILQRAPGWIAYSKPILYPLLAAPLYFLLGGSSLVALNALAMAGALLLAAAFLRRLGPDRRAAWTLLSFAGAGSLLCLLAWRMSDALQVALSVGGLVLSLAAERGLRGTESTPARWSLDAGWAPWVGGALLGALVTLRYPNALLVGGLALALVLKRRWRRLTAVLIGAILSFSALGGLQVATTGALTPYKAVRASFNPDTGYPISDEPAATDYEFDVMTKTARIFVRPSWSPRASAFAALYFVIGRHTGLLAYLPMALVLAWAVARKPDRISWSVAGSALALAGFYLVWLPNNYFGGAAFIGNRYFVVAYPALLVALTRLPGRRALTVAWLAAGVSFISAVASIAGPGRGDAGTQSHAYAGLFRLLPYESVARDIEGRRDRYWSDEFLRFVDPFARVDELSARLEAGGRPAEVLVATPRPHDILRFLVRSEAPVVDLKLRDWRGRHRVKLEEEQGAPGTGARGLVEIEASPPWRRHPFWWTGREVWRTHVLRFSASTPGGRGAPVDFTYLGPYRPVPKFYRAVRMEGTLPSFARPGEPTSVRLTLRNAGLRYWASNEAVPIHLGYRLEKDGQELALDLSTTLVAFERRVERGEEVGIEIPISWPTPGAYRTRIDLSLGGALWFEEIVGEALLDGEVRVLEAPGDEAI